jgi:hypothetical protein
VGLEQGPLSLVRITEELLEWKTKISGREDPLRRNKEYVDLYIHPPYGFMVL